MYMLQICALLKASLVSSQVHRTVIPSAPLHCTTVRHMWTLIINILDKRGVLLDACTLLLGSECNMS